MSCSVMLKDNLSLSGTCCEEHTAVSGVFPTHFDNKSQCYVWENYIIHVTSPM